MQFHFTKTAEVRSGRRFPEGTIFVSDFEKEFPDSFADGGLIACSDRPRSGRLRLWLLSRTGRWSVLDADIKVDGLAKSVDSYRRKKAAKIRRQSAPKDSRYWESLMKHERRKKKGSSGEFFDRNRNITEYECTKIALNDFPRSYSVSTEPKLGKQDEAIARSSTGLNRAVEGRDLAAFLAHSSNLGSSVKTRQATLAAM